jgi:hypothetical protein
LQLRLRNTLRFAHARSDFASFPYDRRMPHGNHRTKSAPYAFGGIGAFTTSSEFTGMAIV